MLQEKISLLTCQLQEKEEKIKLSLKQMKGKKVILFIDGITSFKITELSTWVKSTNNTQLNQKLQEILSCKPTQKKSKDLGMYSLYCWYSK